MNGWNRYLQQFNQVVIEVLGDKLGSGFTFDVHDAWETGLKALTKGVSKQFMYDRDQIFLVFNN